MDEDDPLLSWTKMTLCASLLSDESVIFLDRVQSQLVYQGIPDVALVSAGLVKICRLSEKGTAPPKAPIKGYAPHGGSEKQLGG